MQTILARSRSEGVVRLMCEQPQSRQNASDQLFRGHSLAVVDGLISVTQKAWRIHVAEFNQ